MLHLHQYPIEVKLNKVKCLAYITEQKNEKDSKKADEATKGFASDYGQISYLKFQFRY